MYFKVPGINLPMADLGYYVFALMFSTVFHELGHALAAIRYLIFYKIYYLLLTLVQVFCHLLNLCFYCEQGRHACGRYWFNIHFDITCGICPFG